MELSDTVKQKALVGGLAVLILGMGSYWVFGTGESQPDKVTVAQADGERPARGESVAPVVKKHRKTRPSHIATTMPKAEKRTRPVATRKPVERGNRGKGIRTPKTKKTKPQPMG